MMDCSYPIELFCEMSRSIGMGDITALKNKCKKNQNNERKSRSELSQWTGSPFSRLECLLKP